jgi:lysophospholipase L1-like esterase
MSEKTTGERAPSVPSKRRRLLLFAVVIVATLISAEASLQLASVIARQLVSRSGSSGTANDQMTILCVGDSHTYGLPLPEEDSYPAQLEVALHARHPERRFEIVNLGIPGLNSAFVANRLERQLHQLRPDLVIVWVGINNLWNVVERGADDSRDPWLPVRAALMNVKLFRLTSIAWFNATGHQYDPELRGGWHAAETSPSGRLPAGIKIADPAPGLAHDLRRIAKLTSSLGTPVLFVTYPMKASEGINRVIERAGGRLGVGVIDSQAQLQQAIGDGHGRLELIDYRSGPHPTRLLYAYVVEAMLPVVESTLEAWHGYPLTGSIPSIAAGAH